VSNLADLSNSIWYEWGGDSNDRYRMCDLNGIATVEQLIGDKWYPVSLPKEVDIVLKGIAQLTKRLSRAEAWIHHHKSERGITS
jgi:hypothetical protein